MQENNLYQKGNKELLGMVKDKNCSKDRMQELIEQIKNLNEPILDLDGFSTTYLYEAVAYGNVEMVEMLLDKGADPNYCNEKLICDCAFWEVQYPDPLEKGDFADFYKIAKLLLEHGANPNLLSEDETFYDFVAFKVFNDFEYQGEERDYLEELLKLLVFYGGGGHGYPKPDIVAKLDMSRIDDYHYGAAINSEGKSWCCIKDPEENVAVWM